MCHAVFVTFLNSLSSECCCLEKNTLQKGEKILIVNGYKFFFKVKNNLGFKDYLRWRLSIA